MPPSNIAENRNTYMRQYYVKNRETILERNKKYREANLEKVKGGISRLRRERRDKIDEIKHIQGCQVCDESSPVCLDFHHRNPESKVGCVSQMVQCSWDMVLVEIEKCDILCANCHRKLTHGVI